MEQLAGDAFLAQRLHQFQALTGLCFAEVEEKDLCAGGDVFRHQAKFFHHIINAVYAKGDTNAGNAIHAKQTGEVIISSATTDAAHLNTNGFHFKNSSGIIIQSPGEGEICFQQARVERVEVSKFFNAFGAFGVLAEKRFCAAQFFFFGSADLEVLFDGFYLCCGKTFGQQFFFHFIHADLIQFIDGHCDIYHIGRTAAKVGERGEDLSVIDPDTNGNA